VSLQHARGDLALLDEAAADLQRALDEATRLAQRIYPPLLEAGGLAATLRAAAAAAGIEASVDVTAAGAYPPEVAATIYFCWLAALAGPADARPTIEVHNDGEELTFEILTRARGLERHRDRVEALGGRLMVRRERGGTRLSGSLPVAR
jgi:signal transduction histidine kinase